MRLKRPEAKDPFDETGIIPLINIVFLLLVFFLLAGRISATEPVPVDPPDTSEAPDDPSEPSVLIIDAAGAVYLNGALLATPLSTNDIAAAVGDGLAIVRADRAADAARVLDVAASLRAAGIGESRLVVKIGR